MFQNLHAKNGVYNQTNVLAKLKWLSVGAACRMKCHLVVPVQGRPCKTIIDFICQNVCLLSVHDSCRASHLAPPFWCEWGGECLCAGVVRFHTDMEHSGGSCCAARGTAQWA